MSEATALKSATEGGVPRESDRIVNAEGQSMSDASAVQSDTPAASVEDNSRQIEQEDLVSLMHT